MLPKIPQDWDVPALYGRWLLSPPGAFLRGFYCSVAQLSLGMGGNFRSFMALGKDFGLCSKSISDCDLGAMGTDSHASVASLVTCGDKSSWCLITLITHLGELKALTFCSGKSAPVGSCLHSQWWSGAGPCWLCTWKILDGGFLHSSFWPWPSGSRYAALRSMQCLSCCNIPVMVPEGHFHLSRYNRALKSFLCASGLHMTARRELQRTEISDRNDNRMHPKLSDIFPSNTHSALLSGTYSLEECSPVSLG